MRSRCIALTIPALFALSTSLAGASGIATYVEPQEASPVRVQGCNAGLEHVNSGWGTDFYRLNMSAQFKNLGSKVAVAVLVHFQLANAFGDVIGNRFGESAGRFSPNVEIDGQKWSETDTWPGLGIVRCSISRVLFDDGSTWTDAQQAPPASQ
jgi:hypothetical protein